MAGANSYGAYTADERFAAEQAWTQSRANNGLVKSDLLHEALAEIMSDPDYPGEGLACSIAAPLHMKVSAGVIWSFGWWQAGDGSWWLLVRAAEVASFTRGDADFYIPQGDIDNVPTA